MASLFKTPYWNDYFLFYEFFIYTAYFNHNTYRIFSIRRPQRLFQTWPCGPGVYLTSAIYSSPIFIKQWFLIVIFDKNVSG